MKPWTFTEYNHIDASQVGQLILELSSERVDAYFENMRRITLMQHTQEIKETRTG